MIRRILLTTCLATLTLATQAQTIASGPWVRATVPGQKATGLFVELKSPTAARLVGGQSPAAGRVEIHEMSMDGGVMRMRALPALPLPAGQPVTLKPGGYHLMLMDLKDTVKVGDTVRVSLTIERDAGKTETLEVDAPVMLKPGSH